MPAELVRLANNPQKVWIQLRGSAGDIHRGDGGAGREQFQDTLGDFARHDLRSLWTCLHVTVMAGLIAELPNVDLQGRGLFSDQSSASALDQCPLEIGSEARSVVKNGQRSLLKSHQQQPPLPLPGAQHAACASLVTR